MDQKLKRSLWTVLFSILSPGLGQIYLGKIRRGIIFYVGYLIMSASPFLYLMDINTTGSLKILTIPSYVLYFYAGFDAYVASRRSEGLTFGKRCLIIYLLSILLAFGIAVYVRENYVQPFRIPSQSMSPTMLPGDEIFVDKKIFKNSDPQRWDIVNFIYPVDRKKVFLKRIAGLPNETIEIKDGSILINGMPVSRPESVKSLYYFNRGDFGKEGQQIKIPADSYFVLGDNSASSYDSRYWGFVLRKDILGKAYKILSPSDRSGPLK